MSTKQGNPRADALNPNNKAFNKATPANNQRSNSKNSNNSAYQGGKSGRSR